MNEKTIEKIIFENKINKMILEQETLKNITIKNITGALKMTNEMTITEKEIDFYIENQNKYTWENLPEYEKLTKPFYNNFKQYHQIENEIIKNIGLTQFYLLQADYKNSTDKEKIKTKHKRLYIKMFEQENQTNTPIYNLQKNVKQEIQSNLITNAIYNCTPTERKIIAYCIAQVNNQKIIKYRADGTETENLKNTESISIGVIKFKISDFLKTMQIKRINNDNIKNAINTITDCKIKLENEKGDFLNATWFSYSAYMAEEKTCYLKFNDLMYLYLMQQSENFTNLKLKIIGQAKSIYTIRYYEILTSAKGFKGKGGNKKNQWFFEMTPEEIKNKFDLKNEYENRTDNFNKRIINEPIAELNEINDEFKTEIEKILDGKKIAKYRFICTATEQDKPQKIAKSKAGKLNNPTKSKLTQTIETARTESENEQEELTKFYEENKKACEELKKTVKKEIGEIDYVYNLRIAKTLKDSKK